MKTKLLGVMLLAGGALFAETHFSVGIGVGGYGYAAPPVVAYASPYPGDGYEWIDGYWYQVGPRRLWREGYWGRRSYGRGYVVAPRYDGNRYGQGFRGNSYGYNRNQSFGNSYNGNSNGAGFSRNQSNGSGYDRNQSNGSNNGGNRDFNRSNGRR